MRLNIIVYGINFFDKIFNFDYEQCYDWEIFVNSKSFRILIKRDELFYSNIEYNIQKRIKEYNELSQNCDLLIIYSNELHEINYNTDSKPNFFSGILTNPKICVITGGVITENEEFIKKNFTNFDWLRQTTEVYKDLSNKLNELSPHTTKQFYFDALLGITRPYRDFVYDKIINENLQKKFIYSYHNDIRSDNWIKDQDVDYSKALENNPSGKFYSSRPIEYYGKNVWIAHVIPFGVYNQSCYSIITESNACNGICFPTEKTAKPILAKRLFVVFSGQYFLKTLKDFGFKTFSEIINEDYDSEPRHKVRWQMAWASVCSLLEMEQQYVLDKIKPIVEHNFDHLMNFDFDQLVKNQCTNYLNNIQTL